MPHRREKTLQIFIPVVCLSGSAEEAASAKESGKSLGQYLLEKEKEEETDREDIEDSEEIPEEETEKKEEEEKKPSTEARMTQETIRQMMAAETKNE